MLLPQLNILKNGDWRDKINFTHIIPKKNHFIWATILVLIFLITFYGYYAIQAYRNAKNIQDSIEELKQALILKDWQTTNNILIKTNTDINKLESSINNLYPFTLLPGISEEAQAVNSIIQASKISIASGILVIDWIKDIPIINNAEFNSFSSLKEADKKEFLLVLSESSDIWNKVNKQTILSLQFLAHAQKTTNIPIINSQINNIGSKLFKAQELFAQIQPWISVFPNIAGYPEEKTYLILLQNNTELRPTGGFIGTYGILKIRNGSVVSFTTDNVYNLDEPAKAFNTKVPPLPIQKYIKQSQWFFRDVNWDPDFPTTAKMAIQFYKDEKGSVKNFDGVIALTPTVVESIMSVLGSVYVDDKEFTSENLIDTLAYHVEKGFKEEGITIYNRKQIIDDVAQQLKEKVFTLSIDQMRSLVPVLFENLNQKQLMFFFENQNVQKIVTNLKWGGKILPFDKDYLYIVDANLGSLKSDPAINRTIDYTINVNEKGNLQATASITYEHTGDFDWKTTRYRTYTRVYVPIGSTFLSSKGNEEDISITNEHGKTVFGTFISIEPGSSETLSFTYILAENVASRILQEDYSLLVQKQAGIRAHDLNINITLPYKIKDIYPSNIFDKKGANQAIGEWDLSVDREIIIKQK